MVFIPEASILSVEFFRDEIHVFGHKDRDRRMVINWKGNELFTLNKLAIGSCTGNNFASSHHFPCFLFLFQKLRPRSSIQFYPTMSCCTIPISTMTTRNGWTIREAEAPRPAEKGAKVRMVRSKSLLINRTPSWIARHV